jgi:hypothetical protein
MTHRPSHTLLVPIYGISSARSSGRFRAGSGGSLASMSTVRQGHIDADLTVDEAFSKVLDFALKCCEEEHDFLTHTFDLKRTETIDMSSENSLQKSMSTLFSHLKMEMQSFFRWIDRRANRYYFLTMMSDVCPSVVRFIHLPIDVSS